MGIHEPSAGNPWITNAEEDNLLQSLNSAPVVFVEDGCVVVHRSGVWVMILPPPSTTLAFIVTLRTARYQHQPTIFFIPPARSTSSTPAEDVYR